MNKKLLLASCLAGTMFSAVAQNRFFDEVFSQVQVDTSVTYSNNRIYWPYVPEGQIPPTGDLKMDFYQPVGDTMSQRPLIILLHTGSFLPQPFNQSVTGSRKDSNIVETAKRFARRGFVTAAISYRLGWNAISSDQDERTSTLLKAVYRGLQDTKNVVRFFKKDHATSDTYKVDPCRIVVMGYGSGGYIALAYATLNKYSEITLEKFLNATTALPYVDTTIMGNFDGRGGDPNFNIENHTEYDNEISMIINAGGAIGDSTWLEAGDVPMVNFHVPGDPYAPYTQGMVIVPTTGGNVVYVSGSRDIARRCNNPAFGDNNALFRSPAFTDVYTQEANERNEGYEGLYAFYTVPASQASPWVWFDVPTAVSRWGQNVVDSYLTSEPDMSKSKAIAYLDTIFGYAVPRIVRANETKCQPQSVSEFESQNLIVAPNPASDMLRVVSDYQLSSIRLTDARGQLVKQVIANGFTAELNVDGLPHGLYFLSIENSKGLVSRRIILQ